jgi:pimeloyl-ACP methyl ester carboxylesterase
MIEDPKKTTARLDDGSTIEIAIYGASPALLLPVNPQPIEGEQAEQMRYYGADPALGQKLILGLSDTLRVIAFDYEGHLRQQPRPDTLTPDHVVMDLLAVADAAGAERFAYYGYSWLAMVGLQLALRTERLSALAMGGYPPIDGPYAEMLQVTMAAYKLAAGLQAVPQDDEWWGEGLSVGETKQYVTLYEALQTFDDRAAQAQIHCPRLCFAGSADEMDYGDNWGNVTVSLAGPIISTRSELESLGWEVHVLDGLDHMGAMQADQVVPLLRPWLAVVV